MIVIVGRVGDEVPESLVDQWRGRDAALLSPGDLSQPGWRHVPFSASDAGDGQAVVAGEEVAVSDIEAVVSTIDTITTADLRQIVREDRAYVAAEMRAFLLAWLTTIRCPVLDPPTPLSLAGCGWRPEHWALVAAAFGIPTETVVEPVDEGAGARDDGGFTVSQVGEDVADAPSAAVAGWVRQLTAAAGMRTLQAEFRDVTPPRLVSAHVVPDFRRAGLAAAALAVLDGMRP